MIRAALLCSLLAACGGGSSAIDATANGDSAVDAPPSPECIAAEGQTSLTFIEDNIFVKSCVFSGCHDGGTGAAGMIDMHPGKAFASLVGVDSKLCPGTNLVTAGHPEQSYIMVMLGQTPPAMQSPPECTIDTTVGEMPQGNPTVLLCSQKRDAIEAWIGSGALND